jgi:hypothetical protein
MNNKIMTGMGCLLLLAAAIAPSVLGHSERAATPLNSYTPPYGADVSGRYVGAAGPAIAIDAYVQASPEYNVLAAGFMLCDMEVQVDDLTWPGNENTVDGTGTGTGVPDLVDDGGLGGACHSNGYTTGAFNTFDCGSGQTALADNGLVTDVWIGASCDWKTDEGGTSSGTTLQLCLVNGVLAFNPLEPPVPTGAVGEAQVLVDCVLQFVDCLLDPTCGATGAVESCGADNTADAIDFGYGSASFNAAVFPTNTGIVNPPPGVTGPCADGAAAVFVFDAVATNGGSYVEGNYVPDATSIQVYLGGAGDIWT